MEMPVSVAQWLFCRQRPDVANASI